MKLTLREQLIQRLLQLPHDRRQEVANFLECGDASPPLIVAQPPLIVAQPPSLVAQPTLIPPNPREPFPNSELPVRQKGERGVAENMEGMEGGDASPHSKDWPHAPIHRLSERGTYIVTAGTLYKQHHFAGAERLTYLEGILLTLSKDYGWQLEAWAVFSNHYHFVAHGLPECGALKAMLKHLHGETSTEINRLDGETERQVWFNFWDTQLTFEKSYLARLNYVHQNAVKHQLVAVANQYPWCSAAWFERTATPAQVTTIYSFGTTKVKLHDEFTPVWS
jgi:REP-associated tyrosine transposase